LSDVFQNAIHAAPLNLLFCRLGCDGANINRKRVRNVIDKKQSRILYVEDEESFGNVVSFALNEQYGYIVEVAGTGEKGVERLKADPYDLVLLDHYLPGMNGLDVLRWMRENAVDVPVIMLTAAGSETVAVEAMKLGAYEYVPKERFEIDHLAIMIGNAMEAALLKRENDRMVAEIREKNIAVMKMFQDTVRTLSHYINNNLATMTLRIQVFQRRLVELSPEEQKRIEQFLEEILHDARMIDAVMKSMMNVSNIVYSKYTGDQEIIDIRDELEKVFQDIQ
jgi:DNA-binding response OmpR family regulator